MQRCEWDGLPITLSVEKVAKTYGQRRVLRDFSLRGESGEVISIVGANGSGKSTLLRIVAGVLRPTRGQVALSVNGAATNEGSERRRSVAYAGPDLTFYHELSGRENLRFFDQVSGRQRAANGYTDLLDRVGLGKRGEDPVGAYSSGMRQRLRLAFALLADAPFLLLDEPSLALDESGVGLIAEMLQEQRMRGGVTLLATNDATEAALGDRFVALGA